MIKELRLRMIVSGCKIVRRCYKKSWNLARDHNRHAFPIFVDMLRSFVKYGAWPENYEQFHFWEHDNEYKDSFITKGRCNKIGDKFCTPESRNLFLNKVDWNQRFTKYVKRDWLYCKTASVEAIRNFLQKHENVVIKRIDGCCGVGISKHHSVDLLNTDSQTDKIFGGGNVILEEVEINAEEIREFSPSSLNTFRFVTCIDRAGVPHIIATAFRMGNGKSHTDNIVTGGIACYIDPETGIVVTDGLNVEGKLFKEHPFSHKTFKGFQIPRWEEARKLVLDLALEIPEARFVGWDVVLTDKGFDILEGNIPPGEELTELDMNGKYRKVLAMY